MGTYRIIQRATPPMLGDDPSPFAVSLGGGYYHVEPRYVLEKNDRLVADAVNGATWTKLTKDAPLDAPKILLTTVYRAADGTAIKSKNGPVTLGDVKLADPTTVQRVSVKMEAVKIGDVVEVTSLLPHHWSA